MPKENIERAIMNQTRTIRLPIHVVKELNVYLRAARELSQKLDHEPTHQEIADLLERPVADVAKLMTLNERISSVELYQGEAQAIVSRYDATSGGVLVALDAIDTDNSGFASIGELTAQYANISEVDFHLIDTNNDNRISFDELYDAEAVTILGKNL